MRPLLAFACTLLVAASSSAKKPDAGPLFDRDAAAQALRSVELVKCKISGGPRGEGHALVTFVGDGTVRDVQVDRGPYVGSPVERCIVAQFKAARVPSFKGDAVKVGKTFRID